MKIRTSILIALLTLTLPSLAQTTLLANMTNVAPEWVNFNVPAGAVLTAQFGCGTKWSTPFTITGATTVSNDWADLKANYPASGITVDSTGCSTFNGLGELWVQQGTTAVAITVLSSPNTIVTVPAIAVTPPTGTITITPGQTGACTWTWTVDSNNNPLLTIK